MAQIEMFYKIINEICEERKISQKDLSYGWVKELKKDNKIHHIVRYQMDLNSAVAYEIAKDKYATYAILAENNIPMIEHYMIFNPETRNTYTDKNTDSLIEKILEQNDIVIKANDSSQGIDVYRASNKDKAKSIICKLFAENKDSISICPYVEIDYEYRVIVLDGKVLYTYKKKKPYVIGNGKNTLQDLIMQKYQSISISENLDLDMIPEIDKEVIVSWKHNLNNGAEPIIINQDEYLEKIEEIAIKASNTIGINFATVDIGLTSEKELTIVEINGSVCMNKFSELIPNGYNIAKDIYSKAIDKMFDII